MAVRSGEPESRHRPSDGHKGGSPHKGGKGKSKSKPTSRCPDCYKPLGSWGASWDQHRYWNENCLAWQAYNHGNGHVSWSAACAAAAETKRRRVALHQQEMAAEAGLPTEFRPPCDVEDMVEGPPRATRAKKEKKDRKKDKKEKKGKKKRTPRASPSPDPVRKGGPKKRPPEDDDSESGHHGRHSKAAVRQLLNAMIKCL